MNVEDVHRHLYNIVCMHAGEPNHFQSSVALVHVDDTAKAHIFLFESPTTGRYICNAVDIATNDMYKLLSQKYPDFHIPSEM